MSSSSDVQLSSLPSLPSDSSTQSGYAVTIHDDLQYVHDHNIRNGTNGNGSPTVTASQVNAYGGPNSLGVTDGRVVAKKLESSGGIHKMRLFQLMIDGTLQVIPRGAPSKTPFRHWVSIIITFLLLWGLAITILYGFVTAFDRFGDNFLWASFAFWIAATTAFVASIIVTNPLRHNDE